MNLFDPIIKAQEIGNVVAKASKRKYYRVARPGRWYGGIASADCCGCNLKCVFCWSDKPRDHPEKYGAFYEPEEIAGSILKCARENAYHQVRISGNEPTIAKEHLTRVISLVSRAGLHFILETNGTLLDDDFVNGLARFQNLHVRVSLKGTDPEEFSMLTGASPETFDMILDNLRSLIEHKVECNLAVMLSFSQDKQISLLKARLAGISPVILDDFEEEYVFLYPHVVQRMKSAGIDPLVAYTPGGVPKRLV